MRITRKSIDDMGGIREIIDGSRAFIAYRGHNPICWKCSIKLDKEQRQLLIDKWAVCEKCYEDYKKEY